MTLEGGKTITQLIQLAAQVKYHEAAYHTCALLASICAGVYIVHQKDFIGLWSRETAMKAHTHRRRAMDLLGIKDADGQHGSHTAPFPEIKEARYFNSVSEMHAFFAARAAKKACLCIPPGPAGADPGAYIHPSCPVHRPLTVAREDRP